MSLRRIKQNHPKRGAYQVLAPTHNMQRDLNFKKQGAVSVLYYARDFCGEPTVTAMAGTSTGSAVTPERVFLFKFNYRTSSKVRLGDECL